ncbi:hypothetical protein T492DRAFT_948737 [Pavlovales sp. CCMP2436]|nr:hypothetical protein T492DRAFT_948737 [Pavlovales sp. CCMP2436]
MAPWLFARNSNCRPVSVAKPVPNASLGRNFCTVVFDDDDDELFSPEDLWLVLCVIVKDFGLWESANTEPNDWVNPPIHTDDQTRKDARGMMRHDLVELFGARSRPMHKDKLCICILRILTVSMILSDRTDRLDFDVTRSHCLVRFDVGVLDKIRLDRLLGQVDTVHGDNLLKAARHGPA